MIWTLQSQGESEFLRFKRLSMGFSSEGSTRRIPSKTHAYACWANLSKPKSRIRNQGSKSRQRVNNRCLAPLLSSHFLVFSSLSLFSSHMYTYIYTCLSINAFTSENFAQSRTGVFYLQHLWVFDSSCSHCFNDDCRSNCTLTIRCS